MSNYTVIASDEEFAAVFKPTTSTVYALNFWAAWAPPCIQMNEVFEELASKNSAIHFIKVSRSVSMEHGEKKRTSWKAHKKSEEWAL